MRMARMLEAEWRKVLRGNVSTGAKEDESSTERIWAAVLHHVTAHSCLACVLKINEPFISLIFQMTETADAESVDTGARLYIQTHTHTHTHTRIHMSSRYVLQALLMSWIGFPNLFVFLLWRYGCRYWCLICSGVCVCCLSTSLKLTYTALAML
jgi:hypothetical protein